MFLQSIPVNSTYATTIASFTSHYTSIKLHDHITWKKTDNQYNNVRYSCLLRLIIPYAM